MHEDHALEEETCDECGNTRQGLCPKCGDFKVTPLEPTGRPVTRSVRDAVQIADDGDEIAFENVCWNCGWTERRTIRVSVEENPDD